MSRIVLNEHFATDVIGGFSLGIMWMILMYAIFQKWLINEKAWIPSPTSKERITE
jgi:membrane-associated phospholipid phosphatase